MEIAGHPGTPAPYRFLDAGEHRRLEQFDALLLDRPAAGATGPRQAPASWVGAAIYRASRGWTRIAGMPDASSVDLAGARLAVRMGPGGGIGVFPEHAASAPWLARAVTARADDGRRPAILNLFAHTGLLTIVAARAGAAVAHVDASRPAVATARGNAERSGVGGAPIRWLIDDVARFVAREQRRGRRYAGVILDPPTYGHGGRRSGSAWTIDDDLGPLLDAARAVAEPDAFWLVTSHSTGWPPDRLAAALAGAAGVPAADVDRETLTLIAESGVRLEMGAAARLDPLAAGRR